MRINIKTPLLWLLPLILLAGCKDKEEPIPAYLKIEPFAVDASGGAAWQKITEGWLYVNDQFLGAYSLPAIVPVLADGDSDIQLFPGVKENGQQLTPGLYPFLERFESTVALSPGQTVDIQPITRYLPNAIFPWPEERSAFDNNSIVLENRDTDTTTSFEITSVGAFEGQSVKMMVDTAHRIMEIVTEEVENLPNTGDRPVWLELHYQNDARFELWIIGNNGAGSIEVPQAIFQFLPSENWNKTYINLTDFLVGLQQSRHRLFFRLGLPVDTGGVILQNSGTVFLDNIRLVHF